MQKLMLGSVALLATLAMTAGGPAALKPAGAWPQAKVADAATVPMAADLSLPFIENRGQLPDGIAFHAPSAHAATYVTDDGEIVYALGGEQGLRLIERFADGVAQPQGVERAATRVSSFVGNDSSRWVSDAATYHKVGFGEVWPGIDVDLHARQGSVEKFFTVSPGVAPDAIELALDGAQDLQVAADGRLVVTLEGAEVAFSAPIAFQEVAGQRQPVRVAYATNGTRYGFTVGDYDRTRPLVIDPTLVYSTLGGGSRDEEPRDFHVDAAGAVYVGGFTVSLDLPVTGSPFGTPADVAGNLARRNGFVAKLAPSGNSYEYFVYVGGLQNDTVEDIEVTADGSIVFVGGTESADMPVSSGAAQPARNGTNRDFFVAKLNPTGTAVQYLTYLGGPGNELGLNDATYLKLAVDGAGRAYVYGMSDAAGYPVTAGAPQATFGGEDDAVLTRVSADGTAFEFSTYLGGPGTEYTDRNGGLVVRDDGRVWVAGRVGAPGFVAGNNVNFPVSAGAALATAVGPAIYVASYDTNTATRRYATLVGGNNSMSLQAMTVDAAGRAVVAGLTRATNLPVQTGAYDTTLSGTSDGFVAILNDTGTAFTAATYFGGSSTDSIDRIRFHPDGSLVVAGYTESSNLPVTPGAYATAPASVFAARFSADLSSLAWSTYLGGGDNSATPADLRLDAAGTVYLLVRTSNNGLPVNDGLTAPTGGGENSQIYLAKLASNGSALIDAAYLAGTDDDDPLGLHVANDNHAYVVGTTQSIDFPVSAGAADSTADDDGEAFIAKLLTRSAPLPPSAGSIAWSAATATVGENAGTVTLTATRAGGTAGAVSVQYATAAGTATAGSDFTAASGSLNWADGETGSKTVTVTITNDTTVEAGENFTVVLSNPAGAVLGSPASTTVTITDDDVPPAGAVAFSAATYSATESQGSITITVTRSGGTAGAASVNYAAAAGTAAAGSDFTAASGVLTWADGEAGSKTFVVDVLEDTVSESSETITLTLSQATVATLGSPSTATLTITDNDAPATRPVRARGSYGGGSAEAWLLGLLALLVLRRRMRRQLLATVPVALGLATATAQAADTGGWYVGARAGVAATSQGSDDLNRKLAAAGTGLTANVDDQDFGGALYLGYAFGNGFALEGGFVDLGEYEVGIEGDVADPAAELAAAAKVLGSGGYGITALARWNIALGESIEFAPRAGVYYWSSENELRDGTTRATQDEDGVDFTGGLSFAWRVTPQWSLGVAWDYYPQGEHNDVQVYGVQAEYRWP